MELGETEPKVSDKFLDKYMRINYTDFIIKLQVFTK